MAETYIRDGIALEKGVVLTKQFLDDNQALFTSYLNYWLLYPDLFLDAIQPEDDKKHFHLFFYQRIALRASMRYRYHYWTATRATSKSFTAYLSSVVRAVLLPGSNIFISSFFLISSIFSFANLTKSPALNFSVGIITSIK